MLVKEIVDLVHAPSMSDIPIRAKLILILFAFLVYSLLVRFWACLYLRTLEYGASFPENSEKVERDCVWADKEKVEATDKPYHEITNRECVSIPERAFSCWSVCNN